MSEYCSYLWGACLAFALLVQSSFAYPHWPDQAPHQVAELGDLRLENGRVIKNLRMSYVTHGRLNPARDNAILFMHGFGANHHGGDHLIGPGRPLDTNQYFVICPDALGNTQTTFEHSTSPTNSGLKMEFPFYNGRDMVNAVHKLITEGLGIPRLLAMGGISMGADHSVQFAASYPDFTKGIFPISGGALWGSEGYFSTSLLESSIEACAGWNGGNYEKNPESCGAIALSVLVPYFYTRDWWDRNVDTPEAFQKWRNAWGEYYLDIQDARDLYYHSKAGGLGWLGDTPGFDGDVEKALRSIRAKAIFIFSPHDRFMSPEHIDTQVRSIPEARAVPIESAAGHLFCCNADPNATHVMSEAITAFLRELKSQNAAAGR